VTDIADVLQTSSKVLREIIKRNREVFGNYCQTGDSLFQIKRGTPCSPLWNLWKNFKPQTIFLNRQGIILLLMKISPNFIKDPERREAVINFQLWAVEVLAMVMSGKVSLEGSQFIGELFAVPYGRKVKAVKKACEQFNRSRRTIYYWLGNEFTQKTGYIPPRKPRSDKGKFRKIPEGFEKKFWEFLSDHPWVSIRQAYRELAYGICSLSTFNRFYKQVLENAQRRTKNQEAFA